MEKLAWCWGASGLVIFFVELTVSVDQVHRGSSACAGFVFPVTGPQPPASDAQDKLLRTTKYT